MSRVLTKVCHGLRDPGVKPTAVAVELGLTSDETNKMPFGPSITVAGGGRRSATESR